MLAGEESARKGALQHARRLSAERTGHGVNCPEPAVPSRATAPRADTEAGRCERDEVAIGVGKASCLRASPRRRCRGRVRWQHRSPSVAHRGGAAFRTTSKDAAAPCRLSTIHLHTGLTTSPG